MSASEKTAMKEIFDADQFRHIAEESAAIYPEFDVPGFLAAALPGLDGLTLMQRLRKMTESLHTFLPKDYPQALAILRDLAPRIRNKFVTLVLPDYVALYGLDDFENSMEALKFFTTFGSSEFGIRAFLRKDISRTLSALEIWSHDQDAAVRRLASEGCRPRLPWSFRLNSIIDDPFLTKQILHNLKADPSLYVRKSVANHLNDITKDHPDQVMEWLEDWPLDNKHSAWIAKRGLRTLIKNGVPRALVIIGVGKSVKVEIENFFVGPQNLRLGERLELSCQIRSGSLKRQRLVVDYIIHYVKNSGRTSAKVFKLRELELDAGASITLTRSQVIRDFTTRIHYPGCHKVEIMVNGQLFAENYFHLFK